MLRSGDIKVSYVAFQKNHTVVFCPLTVKKSFQNNAAVMGITHFTIGGEAPKPEISLRPKYSFQYAHPWL